MSARPYLLLVLLVLLAAVGAACVMSEPDGTSQSGTDSRTSSAPAATESPAATEAPAAPAALAPKLPGFDFQVGEGTFWEYEWEYQSSAFCRDCRGGPTVDSGTFRVTLGPPKAIEGVTAYEIQVSGKHKLDDPATDRSFAPRWRYLAVADNRILVSNDGSSLMALLDGQEGEWPGSGFFTARFKAKDLYEGKLYGRDVLVTASSRSGGCKYYRTVGQVCPGGTSTNYTETEKYQQGIGPVAYSFRFSFSSGSGSTSFSSSTSESVALVGSSLQ